MQYPSTKEKVEARIHSGPHREVIQEMWKTSLEENKQNKQNFLRLLMGHRDPDLSANNEWQIGQTSTEEHQIPLSNAFP